jgi:hypothetical protein
VEGSAVVNDARSGSFKAAAPSPHPSPGHGDAFSSRHRRPRFFSRPLATGVDEFHMLLTVSQAPPRAHIKPRGTAPCKAARHRSAQQAVSIAPCYPGLKVDATLSCRSASSFKSIDGEKGRQRPGLKVGASLSSHLRCIYPPSLRYLLHHLLI